MSVLGGLDLFSNDALARSTKGCTGVSDSERYEDFGDKLPDSGLAELAQQVVRQLASHDVRCKETVVGPSSQEIDEFCAALVSDDDEAAAEMLGGARSAGLSLETICLQYLSAAAHKLGLWWVEDRTSFAEVTIGTGRMSAILHGINRDGAARSPQEDVPLIFASVPGEQHTFGVAMAAELFRRDGWSVALEIGLTHDDLIAAVARSPGRIVGLSIGSQRSFSALARLVHALQTHCPQTAILVSGQAVGVLRQFISNMEVDEIATDIDEAKLKIAQLWDMTSTDWNVREARTA